MPQRALPTPNPHISELLVLHLDEGVESQPASTSSNAHTGVITMVGNAQEDPRDSLPVAYSTVISFSFSPLILSRSRAAFSNSKFLAASRISF
jgi:hypothetical protein